MDKTLPSAPRSIFGRDERYKKLDYQDIQASDNDYQGFIIALQRTEARAIITTLAKYSRYLPETHLLSYGNSDLVRVRQKGTLSLGALQQLDDFNKDLRQELRQDHRFGVHHSQDLFIEKRRSFVADLTNRSLALVKIDAYLDHHKGALSKDNKQQLENERNIHLSAQPILAQQLSIHSKSNKARYLYHYLYEIHFKIPDDALLCLHQGDIKLQGCALYDSMDFDPKLHPMTEAITRLNRSFELVEKYAEIILSRLMSHKTTEHPIPVSIYLDALKNFPGGLGRFNQMVRDFTEHQQRELLIQELRHALADKLTLKALENIVSLLRKSVIELGDRTFSDYINMPHFRNSVAQDLGSMHCPINVAQAHERLLRQHQRSQTAKAVGDVLFYVVLAATYVYPPAGLSATTLTAGRFAVTACHAYYHYSEARHNKELTEMRSLSGLQTYEAYALASSQYQSAITQGLLEVFIPAYGSSSFTKLGGAARALIQSPRNATQIIKLSTKPYWIALHKLSNGRVLVGKISSQVALAAKELKDIAQLAIHGKLGASASALWNSSVSLSLLKAGGSGIAMTAIERYYRGPDFYTQAGFKQTIFVTLGADISLAFFGLGTLEVVERTVAVGGALFAISLLGNLVSGISDEKQIAQRALADSVFGITYALYSVQLQNQARLALISGLPLKAKWSRAGVSLTVFTVGSLINNVIYSQGAIHLMEPSNDRYQFSPWWNN